MHISQHSYRIRHGLLDYRVAGAGGNPTVVVTVTTHLDVAIQTITYSPAKGRERENSSTLI